jgi:hypothetical protein
MKAATAILVLLVTALSAWLVVSIPKDASVPLHQRVVAASIRMVDDARAKLMQGDIGHVRARLSEPESLSNFVSDHGSDIFRQAHAAYKAGDYEKALRLVKPAAAQGEAAAQYLLGILYGQGKGVAVDAQEAVFNYSRAARQGHADAHANLALMLRSGLGVERSDVNALAHIRLAAAQNHQGAKLLQAQWTNVSSAGKAEPVGDDKARALQAAYEDQLRQTQISRSTSSPTVNAPGAGAPIVGQTTPSASGLGLAGIVSTLDPSGTLRATQEAVKAANERSTEVDARLRAIEK